jgi:purine-binding chemotaxis protein CheW
MADLARRGTVGVERRLSASPVAVREFLSFRLSDDVFAVELHRIREIVNPPPITEVPRAHRDVVGLCSVRGLLVTVLDLRRRLRLREAPPTRSTRILLVNTDSTEVVGLLVDEVRQVVRLGTEEIEMTANVLGDLSDQVLGVGRPAGQFIILLDLASIAAT